jgi:hypothetical protein
MAALDVLAVNIVCLVLAQSLTLVLLGVWKKRKGQRAPA